MDTWKTSLSPINFNTYFLVVEDYERTIGTKGMEMNYLLTIRSGASGLVKTSFG